LQLLCNLVVKYVYFWNKLHSMVASFGMRLIKRVGMSKFAGKGILKIGSA